MAKLKKEKGWRISTIEVTVKHRPYYGTAFINADIRHALRYHDEIKAVRAKRVKSRMEM